jgi:hypothetical protein
VNDDWIYSIINQDREHDSGVRAKVSGSVTLSDTEKCKGKKIADLPFSQDLSLLNP